MCVCVRMYYCLLVCMFLREFFTRIETSPDVREVLRVISLKMFPRHQKPHFVYQMNALVSTNHDTLGNDKVMIKVD